MSMRDVIAELKRLEAAATKGPWVHRGMSIRFPNTFGYRAISPKGFGGGDSSNYQKTSTVNAQFIAFTRNHILSLIESYEQVVAALDMAVYDLERIRDANWEAEQMRMGARSGAHVAREALQKLTEVKANE